MTGPAVIAPVAAPVVAPAAPAPAPVVATPAPTQEGRHGVSDAISDIVAQSVAQSMAEQAPAPETPRDPATGQFLPRDQTGDIVADVVAQAMGTQAEMAVTDGEPAPLVLPDGFVAVPKVEGRELATAFKVMDAQGELEVPDFTIRFTANGKERNEPLDKVVRLAQLGYHNEEREQGVQRTRAEMQELTTQAQAIQRYAQQLEAEREAMLTNDDYYLNTRAQFEAQNTPEARLQRTQAQLQDQRDQSTFAQVGQMGQQFFASEMAPSVEVIQNALPTLTVEEIGAKTLLVIDRFRVHTRYGSVIPPNAYNAVREALKNEVVPWAQQLHLTRESDRKQITTQAQAQTTAANAATAKAQADAQRKTTLLTKAGKPGAGVGATKETPAPKPIKTVEDAERAVVEATLAQMGIQRSA